MKAYKWLVVFLYLSFGSSTAVWAGIVNNHWVVKKGDTLYGIARAIYPKSVRSQAKLRKSIVKLNRHVFAKGAKGLSVGDRIRLPGYVFGQSGSIKKKAQTKKRVVVKPKIKKRSDKVKQASSRKKKPAQNKRSAKESARTTVYSSNSQFASDVSMSMGYSLGGDVALISQGGHDISFGSGAHLRFAYDGLWRKTHGFRLALGYQYDKVTADGSDGITDSGQLKGSYLQSMYLFKHSNSLLGIGVSLHDVLYYDTDIYNDTLTVREVVNTEYQAAVGPVLMYEHSRIFGYHTLGLSHTVLESNVFDSLVVVDMSRTEIYYRFNF